LFISFIKDNGVIFFSLMNKIQKVKIFVLLEDIYSFFIDTKRDIYKYTFLTARKMFVHESPCLIMTIASPLLPKALLV
jgi:hypothetical protein